MNLNRGGPLNNSVDKNRSYPFIILNIHKLSLSLSLSLSLKTSIITFHISYSIPYSAFSTSPPPPPFFPFPIMVFFNFLVLVTFSPFDRPQKRKLELFHSWETIRCVGFCSSYSTLLFCLIILFYFLDMGLH